MYIIEDFHEWDAEDDQMLCNCRIGGAPCCIACVQRHEEGEQVLVELPRDASSGHCRGAGREDGIAFQDCGVLGSPAKIVAFLSVVDLTKSAKL